MDRDGKFSELNPNYNNLLHPLTSPFFPVISEANDQIRSLDGPPKWNPKKIQAKGKGESLNVPYQKCVA